MKKLLLLSFLVLTTLTYSFAQEVEIAQEVEKKTSPLRVLISGSFEFGGDEVAKVYFTNGDDQSVRAGQGGSIALGAEYQFPKVEKLLLRTTVGYKYVTTQADNAHIRLTRIPIHVTANWMATEKIRLGAGLVTHQAIRFKADEIGEDITFKGASGPVFEVAYGIVGLSYTAMKYTDQADITYSANAIGVTISGVFGKK
jgi:hypothetical protein